MLILRYIQKIIQFLKEKGSPPILLVSQEN